MRQRPRAELVGPALFLALLCDGGGFENLQDAASLPRSSPFCSALPRTQLRLRGAGRPAEGYPEGGNGDCGIVPVSFTRSLAVCHRDGTPRRHDIFGIAHRAVP